MIRSRSQEGRGNGSSRAIADWLANKCERSFVILLSGTEDLIDELRLRPDRWTVLLSAATVRSFPVCIVKRNFSCGQGRIVSIPDDLSGNWIDDLKQYISNETIDRIWIHSKNVESGCIGLFNCLWKEPGGKKLRCIITGKDFELQRNKRLMNLASHADLPINFLGGQAKVHQWETVTYQVSGRQDQIVDLPDDFHLCIRQPGDLSSFYWQRCPATASNNKIEIAVTALNFRDVMLSTGKLSLNSIPDFEPFRNESTLPIGMEFSGYLNGRRIMGWCKGGAFASSLSNYDQRSIYNVPDSWTLEQAATVPVVYSTAYYSLCIRGNLRKSESVLIHAGAGGVGMAAIRVAQSYSCEIFTTVSNDEKKQLLCTKFSLKPENVLNSRNLNFYEDIMRLTNGKGVDIVLNSLSGEFLQYSLKALAKNGRFLEIGKYDLQINSTLKMAVFLRNISFHGILLDGLGEGRSDDLNRIHNYFQVGLESGVVVPLEHVTYKAVEVVSAFRLMAQGKHLGKVLVRIRDNHKVLPIMDSILDRLRLPSNRWFLVTGGTGGLGLQLVDFLITRGVTHLVLTSRKGVHNGYQDYMLRSVIGRHSHVKVIILKNTLSSTGDVIQMFKSLKSSRHLEDNRLCGVFHLAGVLSDKLFQSLNVSDFQYVLKPKYITAKLLDSFLQPPPEYFVVFSSIAAGLGNAGQSNYGMANSAIDQLCSNRNKRGLYGLSIQWGPIDQVGMFANLSTTNTRSLISSSMPCTKSYISPLKIEDFLRNLEAAMLSYEKSRSHEKMGVSAIYARKHQSLDAFARPSIQGTETKTIADVLNNILGLNDPEKLDPELKMSDYGLDSLSAVEMSQIIETRFGVIIQTKDLQKTKLKDVLSIGETKIKHTKSVSDAVLLPPLTTLTISNEPFVLMSKGGEKGITILFHPIEGHVDCFDHLINHLQIKTDIYAIRPTRDSPKDTMDHLNQYILSASEGLFDKYPTGPFTIIAYSFGCTLALMFIESARLKPSRTILIDGAPVQLLAMSKKYINEKMTDTMIESEAFHYFVSISLTIARQSKYIMDREKVISRLSKCKDTDERKAALVSICRTLGFDAPDAGEAASLFLSRLYMSSTVNVDRKYCIKVPITLIKASETMNALGPNFATDYGLKAIIGPDNLSIFSIDTDHVNILNDANSTEIASIINSAK